MKTPKKPAHVKTSISKVTGKQAPDGISKSALTKVLSKTKSLDLGVIDARSGAMETKAKHTLDGNAPLYKIDGTLNLEAFLANPSAYQRARSENYRELEYHCLISVSQLQRIYGFANLSNDFGGRFQAPSATELVMPSLSAQ